MNVVDSSVAVKWVYAEPGTREALLILDEGVGLTAPALWQLETANVLPRRSRKGRLSGVEVRRRLGYLATVPVTLEEDAALTAEAIGLSLELRHPVYDCLYLALALRERSQVLTAHAPFLKAAVKGGYGTAVRRIGPAQP